MGGEKAVVELEGRPLVRYALDALREVCDDVAVVAKRETLLPVLGGLAEVWIEPGEPRHPLTGVVHALRQAAGRPVLVVAGDLPCLDGSTLRAIASADPQGAAVVAPRVHDRLQPLCALYLPAALGALEGFDPGGRATDLVRSIGVRELAGLDPAAFLNMNRPEDLIQAAVWLSRRPARPAVRPRGR
ncbi:molybdenum cofactor guanylyltransferase [Baekduia soli]|uniref:Molybdenum cofactor guanylyltransferase n=1 Tax=Baekduia soli TaxID=496014 RepID=A0A5B8U575_9ACTN|nr:molybdenum cofactor guanylyltransferase [Baekduia soli]QEC48137.1 molybdenum cofactor guanylyltransferase [Baekduia soli]